MLISLTLIPLAVSGCGTSKKAQARPSTSTSSALTTATPPSSSAPTTVDTTTTAAGPAGYTQCIGNAGSDTSKVQQCGSLLTASACQSLLRILSGSISCRSAMMVANDALILSLETGATGYIHLAGFECYAGDQGTDCSVGRTQFIAQAGGSPSTTTPSSSAPQPTTPTTTVSAAQSPYTFTNGPSCGSFSDGSGSSGSFVRVSNVSCAKADAVVQAWHVGMGAGLNCQATAQGPGENVTCIGISPAGREETVEFNAQ